MRQQLIWAEISWLAPVEDGLRDVRREVAEANNPREIGWAHVFPIDEALRSKSNAAADGVASAAVGQFPPAADDRIDIKRIELQPVAAPADALGRDHRRAASEKGIEHNFGASRAVEDRIGD